MAIHIFLYNTSTVYSSEKLLALSRPQSVKVNIKKAGVLVYLFFNSQHMRQAVNKKQNLTVVSCQTLVHTSLNILTSAPLGTLVNSQKHSRMARTVVLLQFLTAQASRAVQVLETPVSCCHYGAAVHYTHPSAITAAHAATQVMRLRLPKKHKPTL